MTKSSIPDATESQARRQALEVALATIEKQFGKGSITTLSDNRKLDVQVIPTGSLSLDLALGVGGVPRGRIIEIYGPESSGKTTLAMHITAEAQKLGGLAAFIDAEHAFNPEYARNIGLKLEDLLVSQPDSGEQALEIAETLIRSNAIDVIVVDSVAALVPRSEIEGEMGDSQMGVQARLMSQALRKLTAAVSKSKTCLIFINQLRMKIGVMFGNPETTTGGMALKFYSSVRIEIRRTEQLKQGDRVIGNRVRAKVVKNKVAPPFTKAEFEIIFPRGISAAGDILDLGVEHGILEKAGSWFQWGEIKLGQGRDAARAYFENQPPAMTKVRALIIEKVHNQSALSAAPKEETDSVIK
ncbi:recombinase RecA [Candidatus Berkelbacteria bacterium]|nr:recombinase RecA [Candidatus Berkelbacteria bacterium]